MPFPPIHQECDAENRPLLPHIGMRKVKSVLAILAGFLLWQLLRLLVPGLEVHPIFIYIYGMIEIRETSEKTRDYGRMRILATFVAIGIGLPFMILTFFLGILLDPPLAGMTMSVFILSLQKTCFLHN